ncbi:MAG: hypothetical protein GY804_15555 [Alphaproteobacteria bacterium]|nr:hypothetical protein [Alphaproteobacteria bacterium]
MSEKTIQERDEKEDKNKIVTSEQDKEKKKETTTAELLNELPESMPSEMKRVVQMAMTQSSFSGRKSHPLFDKFNEEHVHKYLDYIQRDDDFENQLRASNRWFYLIYTIAGLSFFIFLIIYLLAKDKSLLNDILKFLFAFAGGVGSGYGIRVHKEKKK